MRTPDQWRCPECRGGALKLIQPDTEPAGSFLRRDLVVDHYGCPACGSIFYDDDDKLLRCKSPMQDVPGWAAHHVVDASSATEPDRQHYLCRVDDHESCPGFRLVNRKHVRCSCPCHTKTEPYEYGSHQRPSKYWKDGPGARQRPFWKPPEHDSETNADRNAPREKQESTELKIPPGAVCWHCDGTRECSCITCQRNGGRCAVCDEAAR